MPRVVSHARNFEIAPGIRRASNMGINGSRNDKLNANQKRWIEDNHRYLHLPFKLVQVHRAEFYSQGL